jgi:tetratricopeptide (TPR) repeat protein
MNHARYCGLLCPRLEHLAFAVVLLAAAAAQAAFSGEARLLADAADGRLDEIGLLDAAAIAGGIASEAELTAARRRLDALWLEVGEPLVDKLPAGDRPRAILSALHRLVLTGKYKAECTEVQRTLDSGDYNCVTATVLYLELCRRHGLTGAAVAIPAHVYCRLQGQREQDIQTTCQDWFEVAEQNRNPADNVLAKQIAAQATPPRALSDVELLGKVYYNRGVSQLEAQQYGAAIALLKISLALDPKDEPARNNLLAAHNNWALALCDAGDFAAAADKLAAGRAVDAQYGPLQTNDLYVHQKWVLDLCERGRYSTAVEVLEEGFQRRPDAALFDGGRYAVYGMWSRTLLEDNRIDEAVAVLDSARRRYGDHPELIDQELHAFEAGIAQLLQRGDAQGAQAMRSAALARHPDAAVLRRMKTEPARAVE